MIHVIDASVALKWFRDEHESDQARRVLQKLLDQPKNFAVPELFFFEMQAILIRLFDVQDVVLAMDKLLRLGMYRYPVDFELTCESSQLAEQYGLTGYDASYLALAKLLKGKWITFDQKAIAQAKTSNLCSI